MRRVAFEIHNSHGDPLRGDVRFPEAPATGKLPAVVVCHGFKGFKDWGFFPYIGQRLAQAGMLAVAFNFSGSGIGPDLENFTEPERFAADTMSRQIDDLGVVLDALAAGAIGDGRADPRRLGALGHSRGAATVILRAREDVRLGALVAWAGVARLMRFSERELAVWRARGHMEFLNTRTGQTMRVDYTMVEDFERNRARFDVLGAVAELRLPLLLVHGEEDLSVRVEEARELQAAAPAGRSELLVVPRTGHTFGAEHPWKGTTPALERALEHTIEWLHMGLGPGNLGSEHEP